MHDTNSTNKIVVHYKRYIWMFFFVLSVSILQSLKHGISKRHDLQCKDYLLSRGIHVHQVTKFFLT